MEAVEMTVAGGGGSPTVTRAVVACVTPVRTGSRRRHLWNRKSKSEPEKDHAARRAAAILSTSQQQQQQQMRDNLGYAQDSNTGTGSPMMSLRVRNAAVQCILLVDAESGGCGTISETGSVTTSPSSSAGNMAATAASMSPKRLSVTSPKTPERHLARQTTATGVGDDLSAYRTAVQYQRRKAIALDNRDDDTLLTQHANCVG